MSCTEVFLITSSRVFSVDPLLSSEPAANADVGSSEKSIMIAKSRLMVRFFCIGVPPKVRYALYS